MLKEKLFNYKGKEVYKKKGKLNGEYDFRFWIKKAENHYSNLQAGSEKEVKKEIDQIIKKEELSRKELRQANGNLQTALLNSL